MPPTEGREREIKLELSSAEDRERLLAALPAPQALKEQSNHYYDLPAEELRTAGVMLRLRIERNGGRARARITVKQGSKRDGAGLFDSAEVEHDVPVDAAQAVVAGEAPFASLEGEIVASLSARFGDLAALSRWGTLQNLRSVHPIEPDFVLEIDRATYPDGTVLYEVELESDDPEAARTRLTTLLDGVPVEYRPSTVSKSERLASMR